MAEVQEAAVEDQGKVKKKGGIGAIAVGRSDLYSLNPREIVMRPGWNLRDANFASEPDFLALKDSIRANGVREPITVFFDKTINKAVVDEGHRRLTAVLQLIDEGCPITSIPAICQNRFGNEADRIVDQITKNSFGKPYTALERAGGYRRLMNFGWKVEDIAAKVGVSTATVASSLKLLEAPEDVRQMVQRGEIAATAVTNLLRQTGDAEDARDVILEAQKIAREDGSDRVTASHISEAADDARIQRRTKGGGAGKGRGGRASKKEAKEAEIARAYGLLEAVIEQNKNLPRSVVDKLLDIQAIIRDL